MNLYIYSKESDFKKEQIAEFKKIYKVIFMKKPDFEPLIKDTAEKVVALDPDIVDWKFPNDLISKISNLKAICLATTSYDWVDLKFCAARNISVTHVPKYSTNAIAERSLFMALALTKKYPMLVKGNIKRWNEESVANDMTGKKAGIVGLGAIGTQIADFCLGMKMDVCYYSRIKKEEYKYCPYENLIKSCDYIFVSLSKNADALALFNDNYIKMFNKNANIIITANGFDDVSKKFIKLVADGKINGLAFETSTGDFSKHKGNVFIMPHNAFYTAADDVANMFKIWVETIVSASSEIKNRVN